jgi:hypothetical protein
VPSLSVFSSSKEVAEDEENLLREQDYLYAHTKVIVVPSPIVIIHIL